MSSIKKMTFVLALSVVASSTLAHASIIVYATASDYDTIPGSSLTDVQLNVDMIVRDGQAVFSFVNSSTGQESGVSFKQIVLDAHSQMLDSTILWDPQILTNTSSVSYQTGTAKQVPGWKIQDSVRMISLSAAAPPSKKGLNPGETLEVSFCTSLEDGSDIYDYIAAFAGQNDYVMGFHGISSDIIRGESLTGVYFASEVPEPASISLLGLLGGVLFRRRTR